MEYSSYMLNHSAKKEPSDVSAHFSPHGHIFCSLLGESVSRCQPPPPPFYDYFAAVDQCSPVAHYPGAVALFGTAPSLAPPCFSHGCRGRWIQVGAEAAAGCGSHDGRHSLLPRRAPGPSAPSCAIHYGSQKPMPDLGFFEWSTRLRVFDLCFQEYTGKGKPKIQFCW
jgi:hypothetical protein